MISTPTPICWRMDMRADFGLGTCLKPRSKTSAFLMNRPKVFRLIARCLSTRTLLTSWSPRRTQNGFMLCIGMVGLSLTLAEMANITHLATESSAGHRYTA